MIFDGHFHYAVCFEMGLIDYSNCEGLLSHATHKWAGLSCAHSFSEWNIQKKAPDNVYKCFGIHPQLICHLSDREIRDYISFLEGLAATGQLSGIGEIGFDLFTDDFKNSLDKQKVVWEIELEIAQKYNLPIIVHCRKGNDLLFKYSKDMKKLPAVLFHSFMGSLVEANSLINRGINCFFSFGKQMMNNNKKVIDCVEHLPIENLILETDAPFQKLKDEENTLPGEILNVYEYSYKLRQKSNPLGITISFEDYCDLIIKNVQSLVSSIQI